MTEVIFNEDELKEIYQKVILEPNKKGAKLRFIKCPQCGTEILMVPTLKAMNIAIENHICQHKQQLQDTPIKQHETAIAIRLSLMRQVLKYMYHPQAK
jgi:DNA-directed RNA polymerase subunit RPC12/RpoP